MLPIAPSTYYRAKDLKSCPEKRSPRSQLDDFYIGEIKRIWQNSKCRYGVRKVWQQMREDDLVSRNFSAHRPNQLWVADFTYIKTISVWVYTAFIIDMFARAIVGWKVSNRMNTDMVMVALNQVITDRNKPKEVIHHSDIGVQYLSIRYTSSMTDFGIIASVGTTGDSYDNALAETVNGFYKAEVIHYLKESWTGINDVELATLEWVDWFNRTRLHSTIGYVSPFTYESMYYDNLNRLGLAA